MPDEDDVAAMLINPAYAVSIHPELTGKYEPIITKERWVETNQRLIEEIGPEAWLRRLLMVLEGDFPTNPDDPSVAFGYTRDA